MLKTETKVRRFLSLHKVNNSSKLVYFSYYHIGYDKKDDFKD